MPGSKHPVFCGISINLDEHKKKIYLMVVFIYLPLRDKNLFRQTYITEYLIQIYVDLYLLETVLLTKINSIQV